jgi:pimeloyl-ACP methyl ester carboxylesterase
MDTGNGAPTCKTLYLLHGLSDDHTIWQRRTSIERYAAKYDLAVVMPNAHRSWYTDMEHGGKFFTFISEELPRVCRSFFRCMSDKREDNYVAGLSMRGYGAMKIGFTNPERFAGVAAFSGAFDVYALAKKAQLDNSRYWEDIFGTIDDIPGSKNDVYAVVKKAAESGLPCPKTYVWCGTEDWLIGANRDMRDLLAYDMKRKILICGFFQLFYAEEIVQDDAKVVSKFPGFIFLCHHLIRKFIVFNDGRVSISKAHNTNFFIRCIFADDLCTDRLSGKDRCA